MKKLLLLLVVVVFSLPAKTQDHQNNFNIYWKNGLVAENTDKSFAIKMGGRIQYDVMFINQSDSLEKYFPAFNGSEFRRARLYTKGTLYKNIKFKFQVDFAPGKVVLKDVYIQLVKIPVVGNFRVGHFKEPFGMEMITSSNFITMMERPLANQFDFDRALGFMIYNHHFNKRFSWFAGYFHPDHNLGIYIGKKYDVTFRAFGLPVYQTRNNHYRILHLGAGYSYQYFDGNPKTYKTRPEAHLAPKYINLSLNELDDYSSFKGELAVVFGAVSLEGEYTLTDIHVPASSGLDKTSYSFNAYFATVSWFLTGEHKNYNASKGAFDRLSPKKNFGDNGFGAFELAIRYSNIDLNSYDIIGGAMGNITFGINWYLNPATKFAFNYVHSSVDSFAQKQDLSGSADIYQMRFQITF